MFKNCFEKSDWFLYTHLHIRYGNNIYHSQKLDVIFVGNFQEENISEFTIKIFLFVAKKFRVIAKSEFTNFEA